MFVVLDKLSYIIMSSLTTCKEHGPQCANICSEEFKNLQKHVLHLEEIAAKKDKQISQLMSRMREYEMSEYGLADAVNEIKDCKKIIRARDREIENLTDEINVMKLQLTELTEQHSNQQPSLCELPFLDNKQNRKIQDKNSKKQSTFPTEYLEEVYAIKVQNEKLRQELSRICEKAMELMIQQHIVKHENEMKREAFCPTDQTLSKLESKKKKENSVIRGNNECFNEENILRPSDEYYQTLLHLKKDGVTADDIFRGLEQQIRVLKSNQVILIRRYMILSDKEDHLRKENMKLAKAAHVNWLKDYNNILDFQNAQEASTKTLSPEDCNFLKQIQTNVDSICKDSTCHDTTPKLLNITNELLTEVSLLRKLLEISHYQTQAVEARCFAQDVEMKTLRDLFMLLQAQSDEKMLLGKLAMKVLQLQFNQAACMYELKKYKSNEHMLRKWRISVRDEYEESNKTMASMYLDAQNKVKHLHEVLKDLCQRCNDAL